MKRAGVEVRVALAWGFAAIGVVTLAAAIVVTLYMQSNKIDATKATADAVKVATEKINAERERNVRAGCESQNERHDKTIHALDDLIAKAPADRRVRAKAGRASTILLIDALAPKRDCDAVVASQINSH